MNPDCPKLEKLVSEVCGRAIAVALSLRDPVGMALSAPGSITLATNRLCDDLRRDAEAMIAASAAPVSKIEALILFFTLVCRKAADIASDAPAPRSALCCPEPSLN